MRQIAPDAYWKLRHHVSEARAMNVAVQAAQERANRAQMTVDIELTKLGLDPAVVYQFHDDQCMVSSTPEHDLGPREVPPQEARVPPIEPLPGLACLDDPPE